MGLPLMQPEKGVGGRIGDDDTADGNSVADRYPVDGLRQIGGHLQHKVGASGGGEKYRWLIAVGADGNCGWNENGRSWNAVKCGTPARGAGQIISRRSADTKKYSCVIGGRRRVPLEIDGFQTGAIIKRITSNGGDVDADGHISQAAAILERT